MTLDDYLSNSDLARRNPGLVAGDAAPKAARSKYGNLHTVYGGRIYASKKEAAHAQILNLQKASGDVLCWFPQVAFPVAEGINYIADFVVIYADWHVEIVDCKGFLTKEYKIKRKLFKSKFGREIKEV